MTVATQRRSGGYVERGGGGSSSLADVVELILDRGLVIDVFVRVSLVGIELITIDARIVVASVDTFLRFAEATNRLDLYGKGKGGKDLPELMEGVTESGTKGKTSGVLEAAADKVGDMLGGGREERAEPQERAEREEAPRRRPARQRPREREE
ncbi:gas vesicle protein GvpA/GvpJ/GvpM family [Pseudonocardia hierapolitana]|uniref:Gas vesicle protein A n=1 Tax=Pseudonocardia hierapolitana TaxID=1128676 RepID=A0A561SZ98_9PSEU|nr:gas vesicle protein GvpJ [Pseudonocardia hierapolitana]TWF80161.1 gas vesicle protein GvpA/GvpJ/GvpM family [Pseudonocardia hierapolitana]